MKVKGEKAEIIGRISDGVLCASWSPSGDLVCLVTGKRQLLLLTADFDLVHEGPVEQDDSDERFVNVGWGKKETQFHGTAGKAAAQKRETVLMRPVSDDDSLPRISWRGDGKLFAVNLVDEASSARRIRVFDRFGALQSVSEPVGQLEWNLAWMPSGALIASTAIHPDGRRQVIFFERNGLRHGEFDLRRDLKVSDLQWNSTSELLSIWYEDDLVEIWTRENYYWYLKASLRSSSFSWHPTKPLYALSSSELLQFDWTFARSQADESDKLSMIVVVDGTNLLLTPFAVANVPPPMSLAKYKLDQVPSNVSIHVIRQTEFFMAVSNEKSIQIIPGSVKDRSVSFGEIQQLEFDDLIDQVVITGDFIFALLRNGAIKVLSHQLELYDTVQCPFDCVISSCGQYLQTYEGKIYTLSPLEYHSSFSRGFCPRFETFNSHIVGVSEEGGHLMILDSVEIMSGCTGLYQTSDFIIASTEKSIHFFNKAGHPTSWTTSVVVKNGEEALRRIETGSTVLIGSMINSSLILQAPRGNLETVYPRAMVLASVRKSLGQLDFKKAYLDCRRHRIDLNVLIDVMGLDGFLQSADLLVKQLSFNQEYLNLFIAALKDEDTTKTKYHDGTASSPADGSIIEGKVNSVCEKIRSIIIKAYPQFTETLMTTYVKQQPSQLEAALDSILEQSSKSASSDELDRALTYLIFLVDAEKLYDVALGMYQLPLALSIGRRSQKDPKEYVPRLEELASISVESVRRFRIDDQLGRHDKAIENYYSSIGIQEDLTWEGFLAYMIQHELYSKALSLLGDDLSMRRKEVMAEFAKYCHGKGQNEAAVSLYKISGLIPEALQVAVDSGLWQQALIIAYEHLSSEEKECLVSDLYDTLVRIKNRPQDAFQMICFASMIQSEQLDCAVEAAVMSGSWLEACALPGVNIPEQILPEAIKAAEALIVELDGLKEKFDEKSSRLMILQRNLLNPPPKPSNPNGVDMINDGLSEMSFRTGAASTIISASNRSSMLSGSTGTRNRKRAEKAKMRAKPGSPFERDGLRLALTEIINSVNLHRTCTIHPLLLVLAEHGQTLLASNLQAKLDQLIQAIASFSAGFKASQDKLTFAMAKDGLISLTMETGVFGEEMENRAAWLKAFSLPSDWSSSNWSLPYL